MGQEIEKKYLIENVPLDVFQMPHYKIIQGYVINVNDSEMRLRKKNNRYYQTVKFGDGLIREEVEIELSKEQFELLWPLTKNQRIKKERYEFSYKGVTIELDIYKQKLQTLITAEAEFKTIEESGIFVPPNWFGQEVTENVKYKNRYLAVHGLPKIKNGEK